MKRRILIVDDDMAVLLTLKAVLELQGFHVETASSTTEALQKMQNGVFQMVITDVRMESEDAGFEVVRAARLARELQASRSQLLVSEQQMNLVTSAADLGLSSACRASSD